MYNDEGKRVLANAWKLNIGVMAEGDAVEHALRDTMKRYPNNLAVLCNVADWFDELRNSCFGG